MMTAEFTLSKCPVAVLPDAKISIRQNLIEFSESNLKSYRLISKTQ